MATKRRREALSRQQFANLHNVSVQAINRAVARGVIRGRTDGRIDPGDEVNVAWGERHAVRIAARISGATDDARLVQLQGAVGERELDLALLRANTVETFELRARLYAEAEAVEVILREFPEQMTVFWGRLGAGFGRALTAAMGDFRRRRGDQHAAVDRALAKAAVAWGQYPARYNGQDGPLLDLADEPATIAEAQRRHALARGEISRIRTRGKVGELLAAWPAKLAADGLRIGWWQELTEHFPAAHGAEVLAAAGVSPDQAVMHAFWVWTHKLMAAGFAHAGLWPGLVRWPDLESVERATAALQAAGARAKAAAT